ncbi:uncharacterized protein BN455_01260 [Firmicutes bacterium CAG:103]|nr:uncharacterized protein BN455_01260 [Firmicutes bacterium CAG:103]
MKKTYVRPEVYFESFELSANIATGCKLISNAAENACAVTDNDLGITYFTDAACGGNYTPPGGNDGLCYGVPQANNNVFTS